MWYRNFNLYAFELIDENALPVLQILMGKQNRIDIGFSLFAQGIHDYFGLEGTIIGVTDENYPEIHDETLFKYPPSDYLGELKNPEGYPTNNVFASANEKIALGNNLVIIGEVLIGVASIPAGGILTEVYLLRKGKKT